MANNLNAVQLPGAATDPKGNDLVTPLQSLLQGINVLGDPRDTTGGAFNTPDQAVAIIESGATNLTKVWATILGVLGGATAITSAATGFWNAQQDGTRVALVATTGAIIAAVVIGLTVIIATDIRARAMGARSIYEARGRIATKFSLRPLQNSRHQPSLPGWADRIQPSAHPGPTETAPTELSQQCTSRKRRPLRSTASNTRRTQSQHHQTAK
jgi:hypothetical protein